MSHAPSRARRIVAALAIAAAAMAAGGAGAAQAATHWVKDKGTVAPPGLNCGKPGYNTIQSAVNAAAPGDEVVVCGGRYAENVLVDRTLTIRGQGNPEVVPADEDA